MIAISARVDIRGSLGMLKRIAALDIRQTFKRLVPSAQYDQERHDRALEGPDGKWPALAASTLERRSRPRGRDRKGKNRSWPTKLLGRMPKAIRSVPTNRSLTVLSRIARFSMVHQAGGRAGHGARIPRRQYLWISPWLLRRAAEEFQRALNRIP